MKKRLIAFMLSASLMVGLAPAAFAASDIDKHWAKTYIEYLNEEGVYKPSATTGDFEPDRDMTRAEFMRYINRAFHFTETAAINYDDVKSNAWYYDTVRIAAKYGYINGVGDNKMEPEGPVTREQAATLIGRLFKADPGDIDPESLSFTDKDKISKWSAGYIKAATDKGFLAGYTDGSFKPDQVVSRGEVAKILYFYLGTSLSTAGKAYTGADLKSDTANVTISENCTLSDATITGDLYITEGLGADAVTLTNVKVEGSVIVSGGTVTMVNTTSDHMIVSSPMGRLLQVTATGASHIRETEIDSNATLYERGLTTTGYEGFADVAVDGGSRVSLTLDAAVSNLHLAGEASVNTTAGTSIYHLTADKAASVTGYGSIYQAEINVNGVTIAKDVAVSGYTLASGVTANIGGNTVNTSSAASVTPTSISVDLNDLSPLGAAVDISLPTGAKVQTVTCDGLILSPSVAYTETANGIRVQTSYLATLARGNHTLLITSSDGHKYSIAIAVTNSNSLADASELSFDRYYKSSGFKDLSLRLSSVNAASDIRSVVLGLTNLDYEFDGATRSIVLRRGLLAQLPEGLYTITVNLKTGTEEQAQLTVSDSTPSGLTAQVAEYDTFDPVEVSVPLDLDRLNVRNVTAIRNNAVQTLVQNTDYTVDKTKMTFKKTTLEAFRQSKGLVEFTITMNDNSVVILVVDYI